MATRSNMVVVPKFFRILMQYAPWVSDRTYSLIDGTSTQLDFQPSFPTVLSLPFLVYPHSSSQTCYQVLPSSPRSFQRPSRFLALMKQAILPRSPPQRGADGNVLALAGSANPPAPLSTIYTRRTRIGRGRARAMSWYAIKKPIFIRSNLTWANIVKLNPDKSAMPVRALSTQRRPIMITIRIVWRLMTDPASRHMRHGRKNCSKGKAVWRSMRKSLMRGKRSWIKGKQNLRKGYVCPNWAIN